MAASVITQQMLELRFGVRTVAQYCNDEGGATADATIVAEVLEEAEDEGIGLLGPGYTVEMAEQLAAADASVRGAFLEIAADVMGRRRVALLDAEGRSPFSGLRKRAEAVLTRVGKAQQRAKGEETAGRNRLVKTRTNRKPSPLIMGGTSGNTRGSGGF